MWGDNKTYSYIYVGIQCKCRLNESSDCLLTNCCVHLFHDLMMLRKKEYFSRIGFMQCGWMVVRSGVCMALHATAYVPCGACSSGCE